MAAMMKLGSDWLDFVDELVVLGVALQSSVKHGHTVALTLWMGIPVVWW